MRSDACSSMYLTMFMTMLLFVIVIPRCEAGTFLGRRVAAAALFGKDSQDEQKRSDVAEIPKPPLPPPPPPKVTKTHLQQSGAATKTPPPPPPKPDTPIPIPKPKTDQGSKEEVTTQASSADNIEPPAPEWTAPVAEKSNNRQDPMLDTQWSQPDQQWTGAWGTNTQYVQHSHHSFYPPGENGYHPQQNAWPSLEEQLADSAARENDLMGQVQNLTETINSMQQTDHIHVRQMDVLTERIMSAEAQIAMEQNRVLEYEANCTELGREIAALHQELSDWQSRCATFADEHAKNEGRIKELKRSLDEARAEAENLAISIENSRIRDQMDDSRRKNKKTRGLVGWIFSFLWSSEPEDDFDDEQSPRELAKSTLLRALQLERSNVDELEAMVASLQQNNSAIAEVVNSRDLIINELNDRVAVFEEDKVVLKAALKQLQKEMKEEAPRTEKLIDDLEAARQENERLVDEIEALVEMHQKEISSLQKSIAEAQNAANASESNLTAIGQYVDTLEQRLASFAIVRRDVEVREQKCKEIEEQALKAEAERDALRSRIEEFEVEQSDLKSLFEELVQEQSKMREENAKLTQERDSLSEGAQRSREALASLENNMKKRDEEIKQWNSRCKELEADLNSTKLETAEMQTGLQAAAAGSEELNKKLSETHCRTMKLTEGLQAKVAELTRAKEQLEAKSSELKQKDEAISSTAAKLLESQKQLDELHVKLERREEEFKAQEAELSKVKELLKENAETPMVSPASQQKQCAGNSSQTENPGGQATTEVVNARSDANTTKVHDGRQSRNQGREPPLPPPKSPPLGEKKRKAPTPLEQKRNVPFRSARKLFAKATGVHGAFTPPSQKRVQRVHSSRPGPPRANQKAPTKTGSKEAEPPNKEAVAKRPLPPPPASGESPTSTKK